MLGLDLSLSLGSQVTRKQGGGVPNLGPTSIYVSVAEPSGTVIAAIRGLTSGETIASVSPNDGRLALDTSKRNLLIGASALSVGSIAATLTTSAGRALAMAITVVDAPALPSPTLFEAFDTFDGTAANGMTFGTGATLALDTSDKIQGSASIDIQPNSGTSGNATVGYDRTPTTSYDPTAQGVHALYIKTIDNSLLNAVPVTLFRGAASNQITPPEPQPGRYPLGGKWVAFDLATAAPAVFAGGVGTMRRRLGLSGSAATGRHIKGDAWVVNAKSRTIVVFDCDDGYKSQMAVLLKLMQDRGLKLNIQIEFGKLNGSGTGSNQRMVPADIDYMVNQGVRVFSQVDGDDLTSVANYPTIAAALDRMDAVAAALVANGWATAAQAKHVSFPFGSWNEALISGMLSRGYLTGRSVQPLGNYTRFGWDVSRICQPSPGFSSTSTSADLLASYRAAKLTGSDWRPHFHDVDTVVSSIGTTVAAITPLLDEVAADVASGLVDCMFVDEYDAVAAARSVPVFS